MAEKIRQRFRFTGRVQGVGFRSTAQFTARGLGLTGWVRNDYDGSVQMEAQGNEGAIARLIKELRTGCFISIDGIECTTIPLDEHERGFRVRY